MRIVAWCVLVSLLLASGAALLAEKQVSDDEIYDNVRRRLANDAEVKGGALEVKVASGEVTLIGTVENERCRNKAEKLAKKVRGVRGVVNQLQIKRKS